MLSHEEIYPRNCVHSFECKYALLIHLVNLKELRHGSFADFEVSGMQNTTFEHLKEDMTLICEEKIKPRL